MKRYGKKTTVDELIADVAEIGRREEGPVVITFELAGRVFTIEVRMLEVDGVPGPAEQGALNMGNENDLTVRRAQGHEGHCQGCGASVGVYIIHAGSWQTRLCWSCIAYVFERAEEL